MVKLCLQPRKNAPLAKQNLGCKFCLLRRKGFFSGFISKLQGPWHSTEHNPNPAIMSVVSSVQPLVVTFFWHAPMQVGFWSTRTSLHLEADQCENLTPWYKDFLIFHLWPQCFQTYPSPNFHKNSSCGTSILPGKYSNHRASEGPAHGSYLNESQTHSHHPLPPCSKNHIISKNNLH